MTLQLFLKHLIFFVCKHLAEQLKQQIMKVIYFSDGATSQCKNFINLCYHKDDFVLNGISLPQHMERDPVMGLVAMAQ